MRTTIRQQQLETETLCEMLEQWPVDGYSAHAGRISAEKLHGRRMERAQAILTMPANYASLLWEGAELAGTAAWSPLPWDSHHFGFSAGRIDVLVARGGYTQSLSRKLQLLSALVESCRSHNTVHVSTRVLAADLSSIHALEQSGFALIDGIQTFTLSLEDWEPQQQTVPPGVRIGEFEPWQLDGVLEIARSAYRFDRFHADPALPPGAADRLHEDWLRNSCAGKAADLVMVASKERQVLGFVTVKFDTSMQCSNGGRLATIVLVATAEAGRGQGIAKSTTLGVLAMLRQKSTAAVQVGTQLSNIGAGRLYEACGFRLGASTLTFRKLLSEERSQPCA